MQVSLSKRFFDVAQSSSWFPSPQEKQHFQGVPRLGRVQICSVGAGFVRRRVPGRFLMGARDPKPVARMALKIAGVTIK